MYDLIIVGAGPSGVSAALYAQSRGLKILLLEAEKVGGLIGKVSKVSHFTSSLVDETGPDFAKRLEAQVQAAGIEVKFEEVTRIRKDENSYLVETREQDYEAKKVIIAAGVRPKELPMTIPADVQIYHWALGMEDLVKDQIVVVNGGSDGAAKEALYLAQFAREVHIVQDQEKLLCIAEFREQIEANSKIQVHCGAKLSSLEAVDGKIHSLTLSSGEVIEGAPIYVFVQIGLTGNTDCCQELLPVEQGFIVKDSWTHLPGLYVVGDIYDKPIRQVATAVADGCQAAIAAAK